VGQNKWEEIDFQPAGSAGGQHYGWDTTEGNHCFEPAEGCDRSGITFPVAEYGHDQGCSVTGGYVYRGSLYPQLSGIYFFADFCTGEIWAMQQDSSGQWQYGPLIESGVNVASFGEDESGELYILGLNGEILKLTGS
ncbi:MAG: glucose dehydrogenase, partial [Chloroflexi bacterium]|nr:glucose dehydrogenase [Chloroflexota bacterium]